MSFLKSYIITEANQEPKYLHGVELVTYFMELGKQAKHSKKYKAWLKQNHIKETEVVSCDVVMKYLELNAGYKFEEI